jgi:hypothetical protein
MRLTYDLKLESGIGEILHIKSEITLPLALEADTLAQTDTGFQRVFEMIVLQPLLTKLRAHLSKLFEQGPQPPTAPLNMFDADGTEKSSAGNGFEVPRPDKPGQVLKAHLFPDGDNGGGKTSRARATL